MNNRKTVYSHTKEVLDTETGEVIVSEKVSITRTPEEPQYIKLYLDSIGRLTSLPKASNGVLYELLKIMSYSNNGNEIVLNASIRKRMGKHLNISENAFNNEVSRLAKKNIIQKTEPNIYIANPSLFGKGSWQDVYKLRQMKLELIFTDDAISINNVTLNGDSTKLIN